MTDPDFEDLVRDYDLIRMTLEKYPVERAIKVAFYVGGIMTQQRMARAQAKSAQGAVDRTVLIDASDVTDLLAAGVLVNTNV